MTTNGLAESYDTLAAAPLARHAAGASLRHRLPILIFTVLGLLGGTFSWMAYHEVVRALHASGAERLATAGRQVADLLGQSAAARLGEAKQLAADPVTRRIAVDGDPAVVPPAVAAFVGRNASVTVWLYDAGGRVVRPVARGATAAAAPDTGAPPAAPQPGVGPIIARENRIWYYTTVAIEAEAGAAPTGFLSIQRVVPSGQAVALIERLIGTGATLKVGNAAGDLWTDLRALVAAPPATPMGTPTSFATPAGERRLGTMLPVSGAAWLVWVDLPEQLILGPAATLLRRMLPIALGLTLFGALAVYGVSARITRPLEQVAHAAEAIAAGDYTRRVKADRRDEIGRLGVAFNVMAARVAESHEHLEARVHERTHDLEEARAELDRFFSLSLDLLCIAGTDGRFRRVNPAWELTLGWTAEDLTAIPYIDLVHPDDRAATLRESAKLADGGTTIGFENRYRTKGGSYRWLSWKSASLPSRGLVYAAAHDVTEQKATERALHQHGAALATANSELESFSYSVSHDLRSPLRSIDGFAQALAEDYEQRLDDTGRDYLARIRAAAQRMGTLIDDLLSLSRVTRVELVRAPVDLTALATDIAARLREQNPGRAVLWRIEPAVTAEGDARLLRIALENLLGNAWKFTSKREGAIVEFGVEMLGDGRRAFCVRDNGAGFDMAHAAKLFGAFQRLHGVTEFAGTGIGLATVQRIVRRHGGRVWANASPGAGATFFFTLEAA